MMTPDSSVTPKTSPDPPPLALRSTSDVSNGAASWWCLGYGAAPKSSWDAAPLRGCAADMAIVSGLLCDAAPSLVELRKGAASLATPVGGGASASTASKS